MKILRLILSFLGGVGIFVPGLALGEGVILMKDEIVFQSLEVGMYAEVIYLKDRGKKAVVSENQMRREKFEHARGYIKAIEIDTLIVGKGFWEDRIAFELIEKLIIAKTNREIDQLKRKKSDSSGRPRRGWGYASLAPGIVRAGNESAAIGHAFGGLEHVFGRIGLGAELGLAMPFEGRFFLNSVGVFSLLGAVHLSGKAGLNGVVPFVSVGYTAVVRSGHLSLYNWGMGVTLWSQKGRSWRFEIRDHIYARNRDSIHIIEFRICVVR